MRDAAEGAASAGDRKGVAVCPPDELMMVGTVLGSSTAIVTEPREPVECMLLGTLIAVIEVNGGDSKTFADC